MGFKFTEEQQEAYLEKIREGIQRGAAAEELELDRFDTRRWIDEHPDFEERIRDAELDALEHVKEAVYSAAVSGSVPAAKLWLEVNGVEFAERRGRPPKPEDPPGQGFGGDFGAVIPIDPGARRRQGA